VLSIPASHVGFIGGSYSAAAASQDSLRRSSRPLSRGGPPSAYRAVVGTALGELAFDLTSLCWRVVAARSAGRPSPWRD
jgi:hypothetical protein